MVNQKIIIPIKRIILRGDFEFHISRQARDAYDFDQSIYQISGNVLLGNYSAAQTLIEKINKTRNLEHQLSAGELFVMGLMDELNHLICAQYREVVNPNVFVEGLAWLDGRLGESQTDETLIQFSEEFPPLDIYKDNISLTKYFQDKPNRSIILEEMMMLWLANINPAIKVFRELFDDTNLSIKSSYDETIKQLNVFFGYQSKFGSSDQTLIEILQAPALAFPDSLSGQLTYMLDNWGEILTDYLGEQTSSLYQAIDLLKEEKVFRGGGPGPALVPSYDELENVSENFSPDLDWMPRLVLIAKNTHVWLDQLSKKYQMNINHLNEIPDEELDLLAERGITGLWLIGLWERSRASKEIKRRMGAQDAEASAYSLMDYVVAEDIGGPEAATDLSRRARERGIRLGSDMVPNHMGIDSNWIVNHPDWFLGLDTPPFPAYTFNGPDLSPHDGISIYLEDHYYEKSDAAVVFKYINYYTGKTRYIYHGNDGTNTPWNDTAQLDYLKPLVRENVIQTVLHVARQFPVIRFDAAMTLAKKHVQRLWFPLPGKGGAIPSRTPHGLSEDEFEKLMPVEFWREVVDRVAAEVPNTLLLAEAFWMMEGYFVRTLGMHRVYNSAFMHMLRDEENAKYRELIKTTLEFNPQILKRYVNFMNNPDEETAVEQFGRGDKYFGVCTLLATLPGLPMFGHGQFEGFAEKYGMEYRSAKLDEHVDQGLLTHHEKIISPLLRRRRQFAEVDEFFLFDFYTLDGIVDENVFAYSNNMDEQRSLVIYHNHSGDTKGWIKTSAAYTEQGGTTLSQKSLAEGLGLPDNENTYVVFRDNHTDREYLRNCQEVHENGLYFELGEYQALVLLDLRIVHSDAYYPYDKLNDYLGGEPVPNVDDAMKEMHFKDIHWPYRQLVNTENFNHLIGNTLKVRQKRLNRKAINEVQEKNVILLEKIGEFAHGKKPQLPLVQKITEKLEGILSLRSLTVKFPLDKSRKYKRLQKDLLGDLEDDFTWGVLLAWVFTHLLGGVVSDKKFDTLSRDWLDGWYLNKIIGRVFKDLGANPGRAEYGVELVRQMIGQGDWHLQAGSKRRKPYIVIKSWLNNKNLYSLLGINLYENTLWYNKESLEEWLGWMQYLAIIHVLSDKKIEKDEKPKAILASLDILNKIRNAIPESEYQVENLIEILSR